MEVDPVEEQNPPSNVDRILSELSSQASAINKHEQILTEILQRLRPMQSWTGPSRVLSDRYSAFLVLQIFIGDL